MLSLLKKHWKIKTPYDTTALLDRVNRHRNLDLKNELSELHSPWSMKDMKKAVERIQHAIKHTQRIMIFGDYDVDGICGSNILYQGLTALGASVSVRLPHREKDGYGLNMKVIDECAVLGVKVLITVDCGISSVKQIEHGMSKNIDIIVTDHHTIPSELPRAFAILNPKQKDCEYPEKEIVGTVVAFKLLCAIFEVFKKPFSDLEKFLDLAALATVADCAPLQGENRLIVKKGLEKIRSTEHRGIRKLMSSYELEGKKLSSYHLGFLLAPCINAAGRLEDPLTAFQMLLGDESKADELRRLNLERQMLVESALEEVIDRVEKNHQEDPILILWSEDWSPGIIGLLAGKLCEKYSKPAICFTRHGEKFTGSCRSIPDINIIECLSKYQDLYLGFGGHAQAAGVSMEKTKLETFREQFLSDMAIYRKENPHTSELFIDTEIIPREITLEHEESMTILEPFGLGNPKPKFLLKNVGIRETRRVGKTSNHLQMSIQSDNDQWFKAIFFQNGSQEELIRSWKNVDVVLTLEKNTFQERTSVNLQIIDIRKSGPK